MLYLYGPGLKSVWIHSFQCDGSQREIIIYCLPKTASWFDLLPTPGQTSPHEPRHSRSATKLSDPLETFKRVKTEIKKEKYLSCFMFIRIIYMKANYLARRYQECRLQNAVGGWWVGVMTILQPDSNIAGVVSGGCRGVGLRIGWRRCPAGLANGSKINVFCFSNT